MARGTNCFGHAHRSPVPIHSHHIQPLSRNGPDVKTNLVDGCANAHGDVHFLLSAIEKARGYEQIPEEVKRSYGIGVRRIALAGWHGYADAFLAGKLAKEVALWTSDGEPISRGVPAYAYAVVTVDKMLGERSVVDSGVYADWCRERLQRARSSSR